MYKCTYVCIEICCSSKLTKAIINFIQLGGMHFLHRLILRQVYVYCTSQFVTHKIYTYIGQSRWNPWANGANDAPE